MTHVSEPSRVRVTLQGGAFLRNPSTSQLSYHSQVTHSTLQQTICERPDQSPITLSKPNIPVRTAHVNLLVILSEPSHIPSQGGAFLPNAVQSEQRQDNVLARLAIAGSYKADSLHFGSDPVDIRIRINPEIYIRVPVHFQLRKPEFKGSGALMLTKECAL